MFYRHGREDMIKTIFEKKYTVRMCIKNWKKNASDNMTNEDVIIIYRWSNEDPHKNRDNENSEKDFEYKRHFKENIGKSLNRLDIEWCQRIGRVKENSRGTRWVVFLIAKSRVRKVAYLKLAQFSKLLLMASCAKVLSLSFWK